MAKVLIVDDAQDYRESLALLFQDAGHEVACAANGRQALQSVIDRLPDVILLDLFMPEMDGPTFLEVLRLYLQLQSLPVVMLTGMSDNPGVDHAQCHKHSIPAADRYPSAPGIDQPGAGLFRDVPRPDDHESVPHPLHVELDSVDGTGFRVVLPHWSASEYECVSVLGFPFRYDARMANILIIDDCSDFSKSMELWFQSAGHDVRCAINGREGL